MGCSGWRSWRSGGREGLSVSVGGMRLSKSVKSLTQIKRENVVFQQGDFSCGSAALATILRYYFGEDVDEKEIIDGIIDLSEVERLHKIIKRQGLSLLDLKRFAESRGFKARGYRLELEDLLQLEMPAIVPVYWRSYSHFVVVRGVAGDRVLIADPSAGNITMRRRNFLSVWRGKVAFVISNGKKPVSAPLMIAEEDMLFLDPHFVLRGLGNGVLSY